MTEPPALPPEPETLSEPTPGPPTLEPPPPPPRARSYALLPWLCAAGFLTLTFALVWVWHHPASQPQSTAQADAQQIAALDARIARLEQQPAPRPVDLGPLTARVTTLEQRPAATPAQPGTSPDLAPLEARIAALEAKPTANTPSTGRLDAAAGRADAVDAALRTMQSDLTRRLDANEARLATIERNAGQTQALDTSQRTIQADLTRRLDTDEARLATIERNAGQTQALAERADRTARIQAAQLALNAGQKLGDIPGAPPALARFAATAPPTEAALRQAFPPAAGKALAVAHPPTDGKPLLDRVWAQAQDLVTIRQGDRVLLGDPTAGVLEHARAALEVGDLAGAVAAIASLNGAAAQAMAGWLTDARALLDARTALADWAAHA